MSDPIRPLGNNHALLCGLVSGALMAVVLEQDKVGLFTVSLEADGDDFTGRTLIQRPSGTWAVQIVPVDVKHKDL